MRKSRIKFSLDRVGQLIYQIRGQRVMLDSDLARIYGVETKALNRAMKRNRDRFPKDFAFQLSPSEWQNLRYHIGTSSSAAKAQDLRYQIGTLKSARGQHRKYRPYVFTEHGAIMAANVLNSQRAVQMSVFVIRAFIKMREDLAANAAILKRLAEIDKTLLLHDSALRDVYQKSLPLLAPPTVRLRASGAVEQFHP
jgi:phage regulator Rha-like protein